MPRFASARPARCFVTAVIFTAATWLMSSPARADGAAPLGSVRRPVYRDLFQEYLAADPAAVTAKIDAAWRQLFYGDHREQRLYFPVGHSQAYIADIGNEDVRTEGMSYGMMICVQLGRQAEFDRLWSWAKAHMQHKSGPRAGYFAWHCRYDGSQIDPGSASDGEEWFAMTLLFAARQWKGRPSQHDYGAEAQALLTVMLHKTDTQSPPPTNLFDRAQKQVVFAPTLDASQFTDPSYHLPFFYELWARWDGVPDDRAFWAEAAKTSRAFFRRAAHPDTGLMPEYSNFDGSPRPSDRGDFRFDAWRTLSHVALDHAWFGVDPWQVEQSNRVLSFLGKQGLRGANQYSLEGKPLSEDSSAGLNAMAATAGLAARRDLAEPFIRELWEMPIPSGKWRYYDGLLYFLALLQVSGQYRAIGY